MHLCKLPVSLYMYSQYIIMHGHQKKMIISGKTYNVPNALSGSNLASMRELKRKLIAMHEVRLASIFPTSANTCISY